MNIGATSSITSQSSVSSETTNTVSLSDIHHSELLSILPAPRQGNNTFRSFQVAILFYGLNKLLFWFKRQLNTDICDTYTNECVYKKLKMNIMRCWSSQKL